MELCQYTFFECQLDSTIEIAFPTVRKCALAVPKNEFFRNLFNIQKDNSQCSHNR